MRRTEMPKYLDSHPTNPNVPAEVVQAIKQKLEARQPDEFGVVGLNMLVSKDITYCYTEAPNADSVHKTHEKMGLKLGQGDVREVQALV
jgi:hypothetical protein